MTPRITTDLLRGLLVAYAGYKCYMVVYILPLFVRLHSDTTVATAVSIVAASIPIFAYVFVLVALLTQRAPKTTLLLLVLLSTIQVVGTVLGVLAHRWVNETIILQWVLAVGAVGLAYIYYRRVREVQRPNQSPERTAGRSVELL
jgi:hypothetical protein